MSPSRDIPEHWNDMRPLRWGFVGAGRIADSLARALTVAPGEVVAVTARDGQRVKAFADEHDIPRAYTSLEDLLADDEVEAVYVATPHSHHEEPVVEAVRSGRHVLSEKPLSYGLDSARRCVDAARESGTLLMEAMWTRFLPAHRTAAEWMAAGDIGSLRTVRASMGFIASPDPAGRLMAPELAGGALLDLGVYPLSLTRWAIADRGLVDLKVSSMPTATGVDGQQGILMTFDGDVVADLAISLVSPLDGRAWIAGDIGALEIPMFHKAQEVSMVVEHEVVRRSHHPHLVNGLEHQIAAFTQAVTEPEAFDWQQGHPLMPLADTLAVAGWSQTIRDRIGLRFPFERTG